MKKEFVVNRQGKDFVLYAGLLDQAHREGLKRLHTQLLQAPNDENGNLAIVYAEVETEKGVFSGLGDASPQSVSRMIAPHLLRMAETRAKARALRDAINVGTTALEELGDEIDEMHGRQVGARVNRPMSVVPAQAPAAEPLVARQVQRPAAEPVAQPLAAAARPAQHGVVEAAGGESIAATPQQIDRLHKLQAALGRPAMVSSDLTAEQAKAQIIELVGIFNAQSRGGRQQAR